MTYTEHLITVMNSIGDREPIVICDFDGTVTWPESDKTMNAMAKYFGYDSAFAQDRDKLYQEYFPQLEKAEGEERAALQQKWWREQMALIIKHQLPPECYTEAIRKLKFDIRKEASDLFRFCEEHDIPVFVVSAGLGNLIIPLLAFSDNLSMNMRVLSNFVRYAEDKPVSYTPVVTPSNKGDHLYLELSEFENYYAVLFGNEEADLHILPEEISTSILVK